MKQAYKRIEALCKKENRSIEYDDYEELRELIDKQIGVGCISYPPFLWEQLSKRMESQTVYFEDYRLPNGLIRIKGKYPTIRQIVKQLNKIYTRDMIEDHNGFTEIYVKYTNTTMMIVSTSWDS